MVNLHLSDWQWAINTAILLGSAIAGWFARAVWNAVRNLEKEHSVFQQHVAETYVRKDDFKDWANRIEGMLQRIFDKMDSKADK